MLYLLFGSINLPMMIGMLASYAIDLYRHTAQYTHSELHCTISMHNIWTYSGCGCILTVYIYIYVHVWYGCIKQRHMHGWYSTDHVLLSFRPECPPALASQYIYARQVLGSLVVHKCTHTKVSCVTCLHFTFLLHYSGHQSWPIMARMQQCKPQTQ